MARLSKDCPLRQRLRKHEGVEQLCSFPALQPQLSSRKSCSLQFRSRWFIVLPALRSAVKPQHARM